MQKSIENNMAKSNRDNFSEKTRRILRERVGGKCSNPSCKRETCGPSDSEDRSLILGEAAHIRAAAPGGPRYDASMSAEERMHISNGIWLCRDCARLIDINASSYSVETLMAWKEEAEKRQRKYLGHRICMSESIDENIYPVYLSDIPPHVIEFYIDRPQLEQKILNKVLANKQCLMTGIGGIGKTETVKKVLQKIQTIESNESGVRYIIWVNFSNNDLRTSILEALPEFQTAQDKKEAWNECWRMFQRYREQLLLVIDNIESGASDPELEKLASFPCRLVVTSRREDIGGLETILVSVLSEEECIRLFNTYYRGEHNQYALSMVLRLIDYHTIMIELLAKTANMEEWGIEELCTQLVNHGFHMSEESVKGHHEKLKDENKLIEQLKKLFSLTSYQDSFKSMLEQVSVVPAIPFRFKDISRWTTIKKKSELEKMVTTGWLQSDYQFRTTYIMHSVVAAAIRSQFEDTLYYDCRNIIVALANDMHYGHDKHGSEKAWMIPFSWSVSDVMRRQLCSEDDAAFLINLAHIYDDIGNFEAAREFYQRAYDIHRSLKSKEVDLSIDMYNLAQIHMSLDQLNKAREYGEKCLELRLNRNETDKQDLLTVYALMGPIYHRLGDMEKAEEFFSKGQVLIQNNHYIDRIVSNTLICDLASFYRDRGFPDDYSKADQLYRNCIEECNEIFPKKHTETAAVLENYAVLKQFQGDYTSALELTKKAQQIKKDILSRDHPDIIESYINLGYIYYLLDQYENSLNAYAQAEEILNRCHEENTSRMAALYNNKALTVKAYGDNEGALELYKKAEQIRLSYLPENHVLVLTARGNIAHTLTEIGHYKEAVDIFEKIIQNYSDSMPEKEYESDFIATVYNNIAEAYMGLGDYEHAYMYCVDALKMKAHVFGEQSVDYAISLNTMSIILYYRKQYDEAAKMAKATIEIYRALLPEVHHLTSTAYFNLALIEEAENRDEEALEHYQQALRIDSRLGRVDNLIMTAEYIADIYQRNEMPDDEKIYREWINELLEQYS